MEKLNETEVKEMYKLIDEVDELKTQLRERREVFDKANMILIDNINTYNDLISAHKSNMTEKAKVEYTETLNKKLLGGIGIQERVVIDYDPGLALEWAKKHELCLSLDTSAFNKIAKSQDMDFVTKNTKILVTFPKELKL